MEDQKLENLLNLALDATEEEREKSVSLDVGYDAENRTWQVIVRHSGALRQLIAQRYPDVSWQITELSGGYAIVDLPRKDMDKLVRMLQVFYVEKPKQLFFSAEAGRRASCLSSLQTGAGALSGAGVLVAVIDSGVDYFHPDFRTEDGRTRIVALWDQSSSSGHAPDGFLQGCEYTQEQIDAALATGSREQGYALVPEQDLSGHGTAVLGIAAGNGRASGGAGEPFISREACDTAEGRLSADDGIDAGCGIYNTKSRTDGDAGCSQSQLRERLWFSSWKHASGNVSGSDGKSLEEHICDRDGE